MFQSASTARSKRMRDRVQHSWNDWFAVASLVHRIVYPIDTKKWRDRESHLHLLVKDREEGPRQVDRRPTPDPNLFTSEEMEDLKKLNDLIDQANSLLQKIRDTTKNYEVITGHSDGGAEYGEMLIPEGSPVVELAKQLMATCTDANELIYQQPCRFFKPPRGWNPNKP